MKRFLTTLLVMLLASACSSQKTEQQPAGTPQAQQDMQETAKLAQETAPTNPETQAPHPEHPMGMVHDPSNPPVDCPLRKQGLDPTQMKPFEQMEA